MDAPLQAAGTVAGRREYRARAAQNVRREPVSGIPRSHACRSQNSIEQRTAWRVEGTLREFPKFAPVNLWFDYPVHRIDDTGVLEDIKPEDDRPAWNKTWQKNFKGKKSNNDRSKERKNGIYTAFQVCSANGKVMISDLAEYTGKSEKTVRRHLEEHGGFWISDNEVGLK